MNISQATELKQYWVRKTFKGELIHLHVNIDNAKRHAHTCVI